MEKKQIVLRFPAEDARMLSVLAWYECRNINNEMLWLLRKEVERLNISGMYLPDHTIAEVEANTEGV